MSPTRTVNLTRVLVPCFPLGREAAETQPCRVLSERFFRTDLCVSLLVFYKIAQTREGKTRTDITIEEQVALQSQ